MYITILQENLHKALSFVGKTISGKPQLPILNNVLLKTEEGRVCVSTTNLETTTTIYIGAKVDTEGATTVAARPFSEFIASLPSEKITLSLADGVLNAQCGRFTADFVTTSASEFPPLPEKKDAVKCSFESKLFTDAVTFVALAASTDESRPILTGIKLEQRDDELIFAATDGFRLSVITKKTTTGLERNIIIPARIIGEATKLTGDKNATIDMYISPQQNQAFFACGDSEVITRLIEGEFPNYNKIIPGNFTTRVVFDRQDLLAAVKTASIFARNAANVVRFAIKDKELIISANSPQVGRNATIIEIEQEGDNGEIAFNVKFLLDLLTTLTEDRVVFEMTGTLNPGVFKSLTDPTLLHIIMPVRVQG